MNYVERIDQLEAEVADLREKRRTAETERDEARDHAENLLRLGEDHGIDECPDCEDDFAAIRDAVRP